MKSIYRCNIEKYRSKNFDWLLIIPCLIFLTKRSLSLYMFWNSLYLQARVSYKDWFYMRLLMIKWNACKYNFCGTFLGTCNSFWSVGCKLASSPFRKKERAGKIQSFAVSVAHSFSCMLFSLKLKTQKEYFDAFAVAKIGNTKWKKSCRKQFVCVCCSSLRGTKLNQQLLCRPWSASEQTLFTDCSTLVTNC